MTIEDISPYTTAVAVSADLNTTYNFGFKIKAGDEDTVIAQVTATDGTITYPVYNTDYSVTRATDPAVGGTTQFLTSQPLGSSVVWYRKTDKNQGTPLPNQGAYKAATVEAMIDKLTAIIQELSRDADLAVGFPIGTDLTAYDSSLPPPVADKYIVGKSEGGKLKYVESTLTESNLTAYHTGALAAQTAAEAAKTAAETAKTGAETAETNAETAETNAETAQTAAEAAQALAETARDAAIAAVETTAWGYTFDDGVTDADPGTAKLRFNNATITSATELYISQTADEGDIGAVIDLWDASTSTSKATLKFINPTAKTNWVECVITGAATDDGAYWSIPIGSVVQGGSFSDDDGLLLNVQKHGDAGTGAVDSFNSRTGAVTPANSDYDASQIDNDSGVAGTYVSDALDNLADGSAIAANAIDFVHLADVLDEDDMSSNSDTKLATQQSIKNYVDDRSKILQVLQATSDTQSTLSGGSFSTALSQAITPQSTSSKILVLAQIIGGCTTGAYNIGLRLKRGSTVVGAGVGTGSRTPVSSGVNENTGYTHNLYTLTENFLDSPSTTSATTYTIEVGSVYSAGNHFYLNRTVSDADDTYTLRPMSKLTLMEVAG